MSTSGVAASPTNASAMEVDDVSGTSVVGGIDQEATFEVALQQYRQDVIALGVRVATAGNKPRKEVDSLLLQLKQKEVGFEGFRRGCNLGKQFVVWFFKGSQNSSTSGSVVPIGLPLFQWVGTVCDDKKEVFADIEECLRRFEDVLSNHSLDFDDHWYRLLPRCLSTDFRNWLTKYVVASVFTVSWVTLKAGITGRYGVPKEQLRFQRIKEFLNCSKLDSQTVDGFLERFKSLKATSEVTDRYVVAKVLFDAFPESVSRLIIMVMSQASESLFYDLNFVSFLN